MDWPLRDKPIAQAMGAKRGGKDAPKPTASNRVGAKSPPNGQSGL